MGMLMGTLVWAPAWQVGNVLHVICPMDPDFLMHCYSVKSKVGEDI